MNRKSFTGDVGRLRFWVDGPGDIATACPLGSRLVCPCGHVMAAVVHGCVHSHDPNAFKTQHTTLNVMDRGNGLPLQHAQDVRSGLFN